MAKHQNSKLTRIEEINKKLEIRKRVIAKREEYLEYTEQMYVKAAKRYKRDVEKYTVQIDRLMFDMQLLEQEKEECLQQLKQYGSEIRIKRGISA